MNKIIRVKLLLLLLCAVVNNVTATVAQEDIHFEPYTSQLKYTFAFQPLQMFNNGARFDFEIRLKDGNGWLQFGPTIYQIKYSDNLKDPSYYYYLNRDDFEYLMLKWGEINFREPYTKMIGGGLNVNYKKFFESDRMFYYATGLSYTHFNVEYIECVWKDFYEDDLQFLKEALEFRNQPINRIGANFFFGIQPPFISPFVIDIYCGIALRLSLLDSDKPSFDKYKYSYGYSGSILLFGVRFGFGL